MLGSFVFVLDGDARVLESEIKKVGNQFSQDLSPLFLPGNGPPEAWIYTCLERAAARYGELLGVPALDQQLGNIRRTFENASDKPANIIKNQFYALAEQLQRRPEDLARAVGRAESSHGELNVFAQDLEQAIYNWRRRAGE